MKKNINVAVDVETHKLIGDAAKRRGMLKSSFVKSLFDIAAKKEKSSQEMDNYDKNNDSNDNNFRCASSRRND